MNNLRRASSLLLALAALLVAGCHGGAGVQITLSPSAQQSIDANGTLNFVAVLAGDVRNKGVTWELEINNALCSNPSNTVTCGTLSNVTPFSVTYTAPNISSTLDITLKAVSNAQASATQTVAIDVVLAPTFTTTTLPNGANGVPYNQTIVVSGGVTPYIYKYTGNLPAGLSLNATTGAIVGTPSQPVIGQPSTQYNFIVTLTDNGEALPISENLSITVSPPPVLSLTTTAAPQAATNLPYNASVTTQGGVTPLTWSAIGGSLPPGLVLNATSGSISGTPTTAGSYSFQVQVTDSSLPAPGQRVTGTVQLVVVTPAPLAISTQSLPNGTTATPYTGGNLQATGGVAPYTWTLTQGQLPSGLTLSTLTNGTGTITGIPIVAGASTFTVEVQDSVGSTPKTASFTVTIASGSNNASLMNGSYTFFFKGFDSGGPMATAGTITTDGGGNVTTGSEDSNRSSGVTAGIGLVGTYAIGSDGRGTMELAASDPRNPTNTVVTDYELALQSNGNIRFFENNSTSTSTDLFGTHGEGIMKSSVGAFAASTLNGNYAFEFTGPDFTGGSEALAGRVNANGTGSLTAGFSDLNDAGTSSSQTLSGTFTFASGTRGTMQLVYAPPSKSQTELNFDFYFVSASDLFVVEVDTAGTILASPPRLSGEMVLQQPNVAFGTATLQGASVLTGSGSDGGNASIFAGFLTATACDGSTPVTLAYDQNDAGALTSPSLSGTCTIAANGRVSFSNLGSRASVAYLTGAGTGFLIGTDTQVTSGLLEQQTGGPFTLSSVISNYAVGSPPSGDKQASNAGGQVVADGSGNLTGTVDSFAAPTASLTEGKATLDQPFGGFIGVLASNGRGTITDNSPTGFPTNIIFYMVSPSSIRWMSDDSGGQHPLLMFLNH